MRDVSSPPELLKYKILSIREGKEALYDKKHPGNEIQYSPNEKDATQPPVGGLMHLADHPHPELLEQQARP